MPNWCNNILTVTPQEVGDVLSEDVSLGLFVDNDGEPESLSFARTFPVPEALQKTGGWYEWCIDNWGTKWDANSSSIIENTNEKIEVFFETAWAPPFGWYLFVSKLYPNLTFRADYMETGNCFVGYALFQNGQIVEEDERGDITREDYERFGWDADEWDSDFGDE